MVLELLDKNFYARHMDTRGMSVRICFYDYTLILLITHTTFEQRLKFHKRDQDVEGANLLCRRQC